MADYIITVYATILHTALKSTATAEGNFLHSAAVTRNFGHHLTTASRVKQKDVWRAPLKSRDPFLHLIFRRSFFFPKHFPVLIRSEKPLIRGRNYRTRNCRSGTNERKVSINGRSASLISSRNWRAFTRAKWRSRDNGEPVCRTSRPHSSCCNFMLNNSMLNRTCLILLSHWQDWTSLWDIANQKLYHLSPAQKCFKLW